MKQGFYKTLFIIALPIIIQNLFQSLVNLVDTIMVGKIGETELAAVGLGNQIFFLLTLLLFGVGSGGAIFIAQYWGKKDIKGIHKTIGITLVFAFFSSLVFTVVAILFPSWLISLYSHDEAVIQVGAEYLKVAALCYIPMGLSFSFSLALRSTEQVKLPLYATIISLITNICFNYIFIFVLNLGVKGAASATVIARLVEFIFIFYTSFKRKLPIVAKITEYISFTRTHVAHYLRIALPVIINEIFWSTGITMQNVIMARKSTEAIAAFNITGTVSQLTWVFFIGVGNAAAIIIGKKIGERNEAAAKKEAHRFAWFMPLTACAISLLLIPISLSLPLFFSVSEDILKQAANMLLVLMFSYPLKAFNMCMIVGICRSGGDTIYAAIVDSAYLWLMGIPLGAIAAFCFNFDPYLIYAAFIFEELAKAITNFFRLKSGKWLNNVTE